MKDLLGVPLEVGDRVARAYGRVSNIHMEIRTVICVEDNCVYLNGSRVPTYRTDRLLIIPDNYPET